MFYKCFKKMLKITNYAENNIAYFTAFKLKSMFSAE